MLIGYARVSTLDQNLDAQLEALREAGCERIFSDKVSGVSADRPGLAQALDFAREGDTVVVWKLDRLGRSMKGLVDLAADLERRQVELRSITDGIDTRGAAGRFFFHVMAALAVMERDLIRERTAAGLKAARKAGRVGGRPRAMTPAKVEAARVLLAASTPPRDVARAVGVSVATLYRYLPGKGSAESAVSTESVDKVVDKS
ncbi:recombinase family protein [Ectothiorhodospira variabilis]|uniref:recombinase family protein n=1 Tax=Ectothiorhodospira variabilis TaxID=505694 RepID=UPI001EFAFDF4|nr:recombinase family protein [Ectothiorhodospira variabilis]MCG5495574.1 recombinase family protein [Ectothiorhodospira variabilis]MCG5505182.1 recombinase family protein [Ectothiorhodospira variabilis]MCG5508339.1 recombinase family protein [Ectothiorhodospira variabilis]